MASGRELQLSAIELSHFRNLLRQEAERLQLGPGRRVAFRSLVTVGYALPVVLCTALFAASMVRWSDRGTIEVGSLGQSLVAGGLFWSNIFLAILLFALVPLTLLNLPLISRTIRQSRLSSKLSTLRLLDDLLLPPPRLRASRWPRIVFLVPSLVLLSSFVTVTMPRNLSALAERGPVEAPGAGQSTLALALFVALPVSLFSVESLAHRLRVRLAYLEELVDLRETLGESSTEGATVIPADMALRMALLERASVLEQQALASLDAERKPRQRGGDGQG